MYKSIKKIILAITLIVVICGNVFAGSEIIYDLDGGKINLGPASPEFLDMVVTGDSYAGLFCDFEKSKGYIMHGFAEAGKSVLENRDLMLQAFDSEYKILVMSIGVNDHMRETAPDLFESVILEFIAHAIDTNKIVFFHSFVDYPLAPLLMRKTTPATYDAVLKKLAMLYDNVYYIDVNDCAKNEWVATDNIHYKREFYDEVFRRLQNELRNVTMKKDVVDENGNVDTPAAPAAYIY